MISGLEPCDQLEAEHINNAINWIDTSHEIFRIKKPDTPPKHLVAYFVVYDHRADLLLLVHHTKAKAWLPAGGHVEPGENPQSAVLREAAEELNITAIFTNEFGPRPLFITVNDTKGEDSHTDVSLWFIIEGDSRARLDYDSREIRDYRWLSPKQILATDISDLDPHMHRFVQKFMRSK